MRKRLMLIMSAILVVNLVITLVLVFTNTGDGDSSIPIARTLDEAVETELESIRMIDDTAVASLQEQLAVGEQFSIEPRELAEAWLKDFDFTIGEIVQDGDTATVNVVITSRSLQAAIEEAMPIMGEIIGNLSESDDIEEAYKTCGEVLMDSLRGGQLISRSIDLNFYQRSIDGAWVIDPQSKKDLAAALAAY
ncbi:MAG: hypothetical protein FWD45_05975 [Coriobacteriia bacterium]|nr:hypothetical protein [Coriobacteriia bacterium]